MLLFRQTHIQLPSFFVILPVRLGCPKVWHILFVRFVRSYMPARSGACLTVRHHRPALELPGGAYALGGLNLSLILAPFLELITDLTLKCQ
jgi:hypothetical protein